MIGTKIYKPLQVDELPVYADVQFEVEDPETHEKRVESHKELVGYEPNPVPNTLSKYSEAAEWCNTNDAHIEDLGDYYEVVANGHPEPTREEKAQAIRAERDRRLNDSLWMAERHRDELALGRKTTLSDTEYMRLLDYHQKLRDVPQQAGFPNNVEWPIEPTKKEENLSMAPIGL